MKKWKYDVVFVREDNISYLYIQISKMFSIMLENFYKCEILSCNCITYDNDGKQMFLAIITYKFCNKPSLIQWIKSLFINESKGEKE